MGPYGIVLCFSSGCYYIFLPGTTIIFFCQGLQFIFCVSHNNIFVRNYLLALLTFFSFHLLLFTGAILKLSGKEMPHFEGPAAVYDDEFSAFEAVTEGRVVKGSVLVIRNEG